MASKSLNNTPYSVTVTQSQFLFGQGEYPSPPGTHGAFEVLVDSGKYANDLYIHDNYFDHSTIFLYSSTDTDYASVCDSIPNYSDSPNVHEPRNVRIEHNWIHNAGEGALTINQARWVGIRSHQPSLGWGGIDNDMNAHNSGPNAGGAIYLDQCSNKVEVTGNTGRSTTCHKRSGFWI